MAGKGGGGGGSRTIGAISVPLRTDISGWGKGLKQASVEVDRFYAGVGKVLAQSPFGRAIKGVTDFGKGFQALTKSAVAPLAPIARGLGEVGRQAAAGVADVAKLAGGFAGLALAGAAAVAAIATGGLKRVGELGKDALTLGIAADKLSELQYAAIAAGSSTEELNGFLRDLTGTVHDSIGKITPASDAFRKLGTSAEELNNLTPVKQFATLKAGFEALPDQASKASAAVAIGGEAGLKLLKLLGMGTKEFEGLKKQSRDTGFTVSNEDVARVAAANAAMAKIGTIVESIGNQLAITLSPAIQAVADLFTKWFAETFKDSKTFDSILAGFVGGFGGLADTVVSIGITFKEVFAQIGSYIGDAVSALGRFYMLLGQVTPALSGVGAGLQIAGAEISRAGNGSIEAAKKSRAAFEAAKPSDTINKLYAEFTKRVEEKAKAQAKDTVATQAAATANKPLIAGVAELKQRFTENIKNAGFTEEIKQLNELKGIAIQDRVELTRLANLSREASKRDALAEDLRESTKLPFQKLQEDLNRINQLVKEGKLTQAQAIRGAANKTKESGISGETKFAGALQANSVEGRSYLLSQMQRQAEDPVTIAKQGLALTGQSNTFLGGILQALKSGKPDVMAAF